MSVDLLPNGKAKVRWRDPAVLGADGKPRARSKTFETKKAADAFDRKIKDLVAADAPLPHSTVADDLTFGQLADKWAAHHSEWSKSTRTGNEGIVKNHLKPLIGGIVVRKMTAQQVIGLKEPLERKSLTPTLVRKCMSVTRTILGHGVLVGALPTNPGDVIETRGVMPPAPRKGAVKPLTPVQIEAILTKLRAQDRSPYTERDCVFVSLMAYAGLRPGEAMGLRWSDLDGAKLTIRRSLADGEETVTKRERSDRTLTLWEPLVADLATWRKSERPKKDDPIIPHPEGGFWSKNYYDQWRDRAWTRCGPEGETPYVLRHTHASLRIRAGHDVVKVAKYLGHSLATLMKVYAHAIDEYEDDDEPINPVALIWEARGVAPQDTPETHVPIAEMSEDDLRARLARIEEERAYDEAMKAPESQLRLRNAV